MFCTEDGEYKPSMNKLRPKLKVITEVIFWMGSLIGIMEKIKQSAQLTRGLIDVRYFIINTVEYQGDDLNKSHLVQAPVPILLRFPHNNCVLLKM